MRHYLSLEGCVCKTLTIGNNFVPLYKDYNDHGFHRQWYYVISPLNSFFTTISFLMLGWLSLHALLLFPFSFIIWYFIHGRCTHAPCSIGHPEWAGQRLWLSVSLGNVTCKRGNSQDLLCSLYHRTASAKFLIAIIITRICLHLKRNIRITFQPASLDPVKPQPGILAKIIWSFTGLGLLLYFGYVRLQVWQSLVSLHYS